MKLFNKLYLLIFVVFAFACDPYEDTFQEIEDNASGPIANMEIDLTDDDYALLEGVEGAENVAKYGNFDNEEDVKEFIPMILAQKYPYFDNKSLVTVNYDYYRGYSSAVYPYSGADMFAFGPDEYAAISAEAGTYKYVNSKYDVPNVLAQQKQDAEDGDVLVVSYKYADVDYDAVNAETIYSEDFESLADLSAFDTQSLDGAEKWEIDDGGSNTAAGMSGFAGGNQPNEDWLVLPELDLTTASSAVSLNITQKINFLGNGEIGVNVAIKVATDYDGSNLATATWENLSLDNWPAGDSWDLVDGEASLADYAGQKVHVAFYYLSTADFAPNWGIAELAVEDGSTVETDTKEVFYEFEDGSWSVPDNAYWVTADDFDAMGAPGKYDNFSDSDDPDDYLPTLLEDKYPYAQEEDQKIVVYKFYDGDDKIRGDLYTYQAGSWNVYGANVIEQLQFAKEEGVWVPDNTIAITLSGADYALIGSIEIDNGNTARGENIADFGSFYQNFPGGDTHWETEEIAAVLGQFLKEKYPNKGPGQKFSITYAAYTGSTVDLTMDLIQNEDGDYVVNE